jgi:hypothetical protein
MEVTVKIHDDKSSANWDREFLNFRRRAVVLSDQEFRIRPDHFMLADVSYR